MSHVVKETLGVYSSLLDVVNFPGIDAVESVLHRLLPEPDAEYRPDLPRFRTDQINYIVCYVQRSGSTHLTSLLQGTGLAGKPADFFNVEYDHLPIENSQVFERTGAHSIVNAANVYKVRSVAEYLHTLAGLTRSSNGVFGLKMDLAQAAILIRRGLFWSADWGWKYIFITRRDRLMQAISYHTAVQTGLWSSLSIAAKSAGFDEQAIVNSMMILSDIRRRWECVFSLLGIEPLRITYEELETDPKYVLDKFLGMLGVSFDPGQLNVNSVYRKQRTREADDWAQAIRKGAREGVQTEIEDANAERRGWNARIESLSKELGASTNQVQELSVELAASRNQVQELSVELAGRSEEVRLLSGQRQDLMQTLEALKHEVSNLNGALTAHREEINRLLSKLAAEEWERQTLRDLTDRQKGALETELRQSRTESDRYGADLRVKEDQIRLLLSDLAETNHAMKATRASWSWKITAPVRFVADIFLEISRLPRTAGRRLTQLVLYSQYLWRGSRLAASGLFDSCYYLERNSDVAKSGSESNPLLHYFLFGAAEGRNPHPLFDGKYYLEQNPDVAKSRINPLLHYFCWGANEGRDPHPLFDTSFYLDKYPDVSAGGWNPVAHYLGIGTSEGLDPNPSFDTSEYLQQHPDVALKGLNPLLHHLATRETPRTPVPMAAEVQPLEPPETSLRTALRAAFQESGRPLADSDYDSNPLVSVIIPYFNHGRYLEDAILSSLLACSYPMEIIVVDDGSTDSKSIQVVTDLAAKYHFQLVHQANAGRSAARNAGLQRVRGKFIQFLDADDLLNPNKIDFQVDEFQADPTIDICICEYEFCNGEGQGRFVAQPSKIAGFSFSREDFLLRWERGLSIAIHTALFRRERLDQVRFRQVTRAGHEDWIFWIELASQSPKFNFNPTALAAYRIHGQNTTANNEIMGLDFLRAAMYVMHVGLNTCDNFWQATTEHFRNAYLGYIKQDAITLSRTRPVD